MDTTSLSDSESDKEKSSAEPKKKTKRKSWSWNEHIRFLLGLRKFGRGNWKMVSRLIGHKSPKQVQSHAQKFFLRQQQGHRVKRSIHDFSLGDLESMLAGDIRFTSGGMDIQTLRDAFYSKDGRSTPSAADHLRRSLVRDDSPPEICSSEGEFAADRSRAQTLPLSSASAPLPAVAAVFCAPNCPPISHYSNGVPDIPLLHPSLPFRLPSLPRLPREVELRSFLAAPRRVCEPFPMSLAGMEGVVRPCGFPTEFTTGVIVPHAFRPFHLRRVLEESPEGCALPRRLPLRHVL